MTTAPQKCSPGLSIGGSQATNPLTTGLRSPFCSNTDLKGGQGATKLIPDDAADMHNNSICMGGPAIIDGT